MRKKNSLYYIDLFDSEVFGKTVCKLFLFEQQISLLEIKRYDEFLKNNGVKVVFCFCDFTSNNVNFLEQNLYQLISGQMVYCFERTEWRTALPDGFCFSEKIPNSFNVNLPAMLELVRLLSETSHYFRDALLGSQLAELLYKKWIKNTFNGYAEEVIVAKKCEEIVGFVSLKHKDNDSVYIDLIGVLPAYKGIGIGFSLISKAIEYAVSKGKTLFVKTQIENIRANRLFQRSGFVQKEFKLIYHKHFL